MAMIGCWSLWDGFENTPSLQVCQNWIGKIAGLPHDLTCLVCSNFSRKTHGSTPGGLLSHLRGMSAVKEITAQWAQCR